MRSARIRLNLIRNEVREEAGLGKRRTQFRQRCRNLLVWLFVFVFQDDKALVAGVLKDLANPGQIGLLRFAVSGFDVDFDLDVDGVTNATLEIRVRVVADEVAGVQIDTNPVTVDPLHDLDHLFGRELAVVFDAQKNPFGRGVFGAMVDRGGRFIDSGRIAGELLPGAGKKTNVGARRESPRDRST